MPLIHNLLEISYQPLRLANGLLKGMGLKRPRLRILNYHTLENKEHSMFTDQLLWLSKKWSFISPEDFVAIIKGEKPHERDCLLVTFDDGFSSNRAAAEMILNPMGIKAIFFVISEFVNIESDQIAKQFISKTIYPKMAFEDVPADWSNMRMDDLRFLINTGHTIGCHTATHARLSNVNSINLLESEIVLSADSLEQNLGIKVEHFSFPFGNVGSFSPEALEVARRRFPFIYTGVRGNNTKKVPAWAFRRDATQVKDSLQLVGALLEGGADQFYAASLTKLERWGKEEC
ncbi:MAG: polysaccharide deacetylase family protein [Sediminibacterium sp.]|nr:polysaccharide deacetylase family protein [Sediminibacterium sp.]